MLRQILPILAVLTLLSGCMTREGRRDLPWEQGGYADLEGAAFIGNQGPTHRLGQSGS